jgi:DNA-binding transcriptional ArsR family regulator
MLTTSHALDEIFAALSDPNRRFIVECLCDRPDSVSHLTEHLPLRLPTILHHLRLLEQSGLIHTDKAGGARHCSLEPQGLQRLDQWLTLTRRGWDPRLRRLAVSARE